MKGTRHSEEQIIGILKQGEAGLSTAELCRQYNITEQTYYRWKSKCGGMDSSEAKRLKPETRDSTKERKSISLVWVQMDLGAIAIHPASGGTSIAVCAFSR